MKTFFTAQLLTLLHKIYYCDIQEYRYISMSYVLGIFGIN